MLQHCVEHLHVVRIPGIGQLIEDHQLDHSAQVVFVCIQQLPIQVKEKVWISGVLKKDWVKIMSPQT